MANHTDNRKQPNTTGEKSAKKTTVRRTKTTRRSVLIIDKLADRTITIGGIAVIMAVLVIMVFLVQQVVPLFSGGEIKEHTAYDIPDRSSEPLNVIMDENKTIAAMVLRDGTVKVFHAKSGTALAQKTFSLNNKTVTAFSHTVDRQHVAFGFSDGTVRTGRIDMTAELLPADAVNESSLRKIDDRDSTDGSSIFSRTTGGQIRKVSISTKLEEEVPIFHSGKPVIALAYKIGGEAERPTKAVIAVSESGEVEAVLAQSTLNLLTNALQTEVSTEKLPSLREGVKPAYVLLTDNFDRLMFAEKNGTVYRYDLLNLQKARLVETAKIVPPGVELDSFGYLLGATSIMAGGSDGSVNVFFVLDRKDAGTADGKVIVHTRNYESQPSAVTAFDASQRGKGFVTADDRGNILVRHGTSQKTLLRFHAGGAGDKPIRYAGLSFAPRLNGLIAIQDNGAVDFWDFEIAHPETSWRTLFGKVWYEGYPAPTFTWQSSAASDSYESKYSLIPLIFGTFKATIYSLLFAIPIALLSAIYTSEFVHYRIRSVLKPTMELMASLPSVVLGFVAALVLAPVVENWIAAVLLAFVVGPLCLIIAAYLWQLLPLRFIIRYQGYSKFFLMMAVVSLGFYLAYLLGPHFENFFFNGDFKAWANGDFGSDAPVLFLLLLPFSILFAGYMLSRFYGEKFRSYVRTLSWSRAAFMDMLRWFAVSGGGIVLAYAAANVLGAMGVSVRGGFMGTYVQRNALVVGFVMGFAVIPIIYTIADDALNAVPEHLRAAIAGRRSHALADGHAGRSCPPP